MNNKPYSPLLEKITNYSHKLNKIPLIASITPKAVSTLYIKNLKFGEQELPPIDWLFELVSKRHFAIALLFAIAEPLAQNDQTFADVFIAALYNSLIQIGNMGSDLQGIKVIYGLKIEEAINENHPILSAAQKRYEKQKE